MKEQEKPHTYGNLLIRVQPCPLARSPSGGSSRTAECCGISQCPLWIETFHLSTWLLHISTTPRHEGTPECRLPQATEGGDRIPQRFSPQCLLLYFHSSCVAPSLGSSFQRGLPAVPLHSSSFTLSHPSEKLGYNRLLADSCQASTHCVCSLNPLQGRVVHKPKILN